jgi:hypothetical protein
VAVVTLGGGRQTELFGKVYEWTYVGGRWHLTLVLEDKTLLLMEELQRLLSGAGEISVCEDPEDAIRACQERLAELGKEYKW